MKLFDHSLYSKIRFLEMKNALLEENYQRFRQIYKENAKLYHDMNHHLQVISYLAQQAGNTQISDYVASISEPIRQLPEVIWSGVGLVDAIINHALSQAHARGIVMDVNVEFPDQCTITADDLCVILFNLLDNALENAHAALGKPVISLTIRRIEQFLMIKVQNPCKKSRKKRFGRFFSTKADPLHHGIGLENVRQTAEKYGGNLEITVNEGEFTAAVLLFV